MDRALRSQKFVSGGMLAICGFGVGLNVVLRESMLSYFALSLLTLGLTLMLIGWLQR